MAVPDKTFKNLISSINQGKSYPAVNLVRDNPMIATAISKLLRPNEPRSRLSDTKSTFYDLDQTSIAQISESVIARIKDNENIMQLFPDMELAAQILISSVLSPKDMVKTELIYKFETPILPSALTSKVLTIIEKHLNGHYDIRKMLPEALRVIMFESGAYVKAVIPESSVDELINSGLPFYNQTAAKESLSEVFEGDRIRSLGFLGTPGHRSSQRLSLETFEFEPVNRSTEPGLYIANEAGEYTLQYPDLLEVTDNYELLKMPRLLEKRRREYVRTTIRNRRSSALEKHVTGDQLETLLYKRNNSRYDPLKIVKTKRQTLRRSIGIPMTLKIPTEAVLPVYIPGDKTRHVGYFVLIDSVGNPLSRDSIGMTSGDLSSLQTDQTASASSMLLAKARMNLVNINNHPLVMQRATKVYANLIESDLLERLRNGIYGKEIEIGNNEDVYRIMFSRALENQYTRVLYLPKELVSYMALKYHDNGIGKSYLDDLKIITSLRAILLFAKVVAMAKSSIALTHVNMTLSPNDPDPKKTIELAVHEIIKMRQQYFPLGINSPIDLVDWIQRAGFEFTFEGHPGLPETKFEFETKNIQHAIPDSELDDLLRKQMFMSLGLTPETIDAGLGNAEFATTIVSNNILLSKRVSQTQDMFLPFIRDYVQKIIQNDFTLRDELEVAIKEELSSLDSYLSDDERSVKDSQPIEFVDLLIDRITDTLTVDLPKPDITTIETQLQAYDNYIESLDKSIDAWISADILPDVVSGELSGYVDALKAMVRGYFVRRWMTANGFMPELAEITSRNEEGRPSIDLYEITREHVEGVTRSCVGYIHQLMGNRAAASADLNPESTSEETGLSGESPESEFETPEAPEESETGTPEERGSAETDETETLI